MQVTDFTIDQIDELKALIAMERHTGRTTRILNGIIDDFFHKPMGTEIQVEDHYFGANMGVVDKKIVIDRSHSPIETQKRKADEMLLSKFRKRMENEHCNVKYHIVRHHDPELIHETKTNTYVVRDTPTFQEECKRKIDEIWKKIHTY